MVTEQAAGQSEGWRFLLLRAVFSPSFHIMNHAGTVRGTVDFVSVVPVLLNITVRSIYLFQLFLIIQRGGFFVRGRQILSQATIATVWTRYHLSVVRDAFRRVFYCIVLRPRGCQGDFVISRWRGRRAGWVILLLPSVSAFLTFRCCCCAAYLPRQDFVFDLHDSMRRAKRVDELETLYSTTFKAVTDAYFKGVRSDGAVYNRKSEWPVGSCFAGLACFPFMQTLNVNTHHGGL